MNETSAEAWLTQEANDLLAEGPFGLYELVWGLNGTSYGLGPDETRQLAQGVTRLIVNEGRAQLFAVEWPSFRVVSGPLPESVLDDATSWSTGESGPLIALVPIGGSR